MRAFRITHVVYIVALVVACGVTVTRLLSAETQYGRVTGVLTKVDGGQQLPGVPVALVSGNDVEMLENIGSYPDSERLILEGMQHSAVYRTTTDARGQFTFPRVEVGEYRLIALTAAHRQPPERVSVKEGATTPVQTALKPTAPFLKIFKPQRVFTSHEQVQFRCHGFTPANSLSIGIYRIEEAMAIEALRGNSSEDGSLILHDVNFQKTDPEKVPWLHREWVVEQPVASRDVEGVFRETLSFGKLPPAVYLLNVTSGANRALDIITVTDLALVMKMSGNGVLAFATDLTTGEAVPGAAIEVRREKEVAGSGRTDGDGIFSWTSAARLSEASLLVIGRQGSSLAVAAGEWYGDDSPDGLTAYTYTDRPVYRPGHTVYFKSILRQAHGRNGYRIPPAQQAKVRVMDGGGNVVYTGQAVSNSFGSLNGTFALDPEAIPGWYSLRLTMHGRDYEQSFQVAEYRKPEYEVTVKVKDSRYSVGDRIAAEISAQYYFGAPVTGAKVSYSVTRNPRWYGGEALGAWDADLPADPDTGEDGGDSGGEMVADGEGKLDDSGRLSIEVPTTHEEEKTPGDEEMDWTYDITAYVTDESDRTEEGSGSALVTQGDVRLDLYRDEYLSRPGQATAVKLKVLDYAGHPLPGRDGQAELVRATWDGNREIQTIETTQSWQSDGNGRAILTVAPTQEGDYRVRVRVRDSRSRPVTATEWLWVMGSDQADFDYPYQNLDVRADRTIYRAGDTAEVVINTRYAPMKALLTLEGESMLTHRVIELKSKSTVIKVPVKGAYLPNISLCVCFVRNKHFYSGETVLNVSRAQLALNVQVSSDRAKYQPGDQALFRVKTTTPDGKPVPAEISLGLVDEAVYAIRPDDTANIVSFFYPRRWNAVRTTFSFPEIYYSGDDKAGSTIRTRKFFPDTAFWEPSTMTDRNGEATFTVAMPDSLTSWRATCRAATADTHVGQATCTTVVSKPFLVRLETPRFVTQGDETQMAVIAHNLTERTVNAQIGLNATGLELVDDPGVRSYLIEPGKMQRVAWTVRARNLGSAEVRAWGRVTDGSEELADAMALPLPILPKGRHRADTRTGAVTGPVQLPFTLEGDLLPGTARLTVRLAPSRAAAMLGALDYLAQYPYGCTEQTMSCFLPDVMIAQFLQKTGQRNDRLQRELPKMVRAGLLRLASYQHDDGGWGWWTHDASDPWMTAYVVFGLYQARQAGYDVSPQGYARAVAALAQLAGQDTIAPTNRAFIAYVLALDGNRELADKLIDRITRIDDGTPGAKPKKMRNWGRSCLALALWQAGRQRDGAALLDAVWRDFAAGKIADAGNEGEFTGFSATDDASVLLYAAAVMSPHDPRIERLADWLLQQREGDHWASTRDTAFILYGMSRYLASSGELKPDFRATVTVGGAQVARRHFTAADVTRPEYVLTLKETQLPARQVLVGIDRSGRGKLFYTVSLERMSSAVDGAAVGSPGVAISRSYRLFDAGAYRRRDETGPTDGSRTVFTVGDVIEVVLQVRANQAVDHLMIEDPLPAGCEASDRGAMSPWEWNYWWAEQITRDEKVSFAVNAMDPGETHLIRYCIAAQTPGTFTALPARIFDMYRPGIWADSGATGIRVKK